MKTTQTIRNIVSFALAVLILGAALVTEAQAQDRIGFGENDQAGRDRIGWGDQDRDGRGRDDRRDGRRDRDDRRDRDGRARLEQRQVRINRYVYRDTLNLSDLFQLQRERSGTEVVRVAVIAMQTDRSLASLSADGRVVASQPLYQGQNVLAPRNSLEIGRDFRRLNLDVTGSAYIETIELTLAHRDSSPGYPGQVLDQRVNQRLGNGQVLDLAYVMNLYQYRYDSIAEIEVEARNNGPFVSSLAFLVNNRQESQASVVPGQATRFFLRQPVEIYAKSLLLQAQGDLVIERIRIRLQR